MKNLAIGPGWRTTMWRGVIGDGKLATEGSRSVCVEAEGRAAGLCGERRWRPTAARRAGPVLRARMGGRRHPGRAGWRGWGGGGRGGGGGGGGGGRRAGRCGVGHIS